MNCADFETLLCDYVDGTLFGEQKESVERHLAECAVCAEQVRDAASAVAFLERTAELEPPPELVNHILFHIPGREGGRDRGGWLKHLRGFFEPVLQPRFAMGMAMTILSFSMLSRFVEIRQLTAEDLNPAKVWMALDDRAHRTWERAVKYYENLRFVYEIQSRLQEWRNQEDERSGSAGANPQTGTTPVQNNQNNQTMPSEPSQGLQERRTK